MSSFNEYKNKRLEEDQELKQEYDALEPEFDIIQAMIDARKERQLTQKELSRLSGITQSDISKIENGTRNPSLALLKRLANAMDCKLKIYFEPNTKKL